MSLVLRLRLVVLRVIAVLSLITSACTVAQEKRKQKDNEQRATHHQEPLKACRIGECSPLGIEIHAQDHEVKEEQKDTKSDRVHRAKKGVKGRRMGQLQGQARHPSNGGYWRDVAPYAVHLTCLRSPASGGRVLKELPLPSGGVGSYPYTATSSAIRCASPPYAPTASSLQGARSTSSMPSGRR